MAKIIKAHLKKVIPSPINPYGNTKYMIEKIITDYAFSDKKFKAISLGILILLVQIISRV